MPGFARSKDSPHVFKNLMVYRLAPDWQPALAAIDTALATQPFAECGQRGTIDINVWLTEIAEHGAFAFEFKGDGAGEQANGQGNTGERALHVKVSFNESGRNEISGVWCAAFSPERWHKVFDFALYRGPHPYSDWWIELLR